jgi:hypothetical protein
MSGEQVKTKMSGLPDQAWRKLLAMAEANNVAVNTAAACVVWWHGREHLPPWRHRGNATKFVEIERRDVCVRLPYVFGDMPAIQWRRMVIDAFGAWAAAGMPDAVAAMADALKSRPAPKKKGDENRMRAAARAAMNAGMPPSALPVSAPSGVVVRRDRPRRIDPKCAPPLGWAADYHAPVVGGRCIDVAGGER